MLTIDGETKPIWMWAEETGNSPQLIRDRLKRGKSVEEAVFFLPRRYKRQPKTTDGQATEVPATNIPGVQCERER